MSIPVRQMLVHSTKHSLKCPYEMTAEYLTVHNTANDATANNEIDYMISNPNQVSFHYAVDEKEVVQGILESRNAWHCGDGGSGTGNRKSIGIEICYSKSGGEKYKLAEEKAVKFIAQLLHQKKWGIEKVKKHQDWSGKYCPHRILSEGRWESFKGRIQTELTRLKTPPKPVNPIYRVKVDGVQLFALSDKENIINQLETHIGKAKKIELERL